MSWKPNRSTFGTPVVPGAEPYSRGPARMGRPVQMGCVPEHDRSSILAAPARLKLAAEAVRRIYVSAGYERLADVRVDVTREARPSAEGPESRHFAACRTDGKLILLAPELGIPEMPDKTMFGIIGHEFGHAADYCYPCQFVPTDNGLRWLYPGPNKQIPRPVRDRWDNRDSDTIESTADRIAEAVMGVRIGYCGQCSLQTLLTGAPGEGACARPRPKGLR